MPTRSRWIQTPTTPSIVKSHISRSWVLVRVVTLLPARCASCGKRSVWSARLTYHVLVLVSPTAGRAASRLDPLTLMASPAEPGAAAENSLRLLAS
jgi:hypothetical protein